MDLDPNLAVPRVPRRERFDAQRIQAADFADDHPAGTGAGVGGHVARTPRLPASLRKARALDRAHHVPLDLDQRPAVEVGDRDVRGGGRPRIALDGEREHVRDEPREDADAIVGVGHGLGPHPSRGADRGGVQERRVQVERLDVGGERRRKRQSIPDATLVLELEARPLPPRASGQACAAKVPARGGLLPPVDGRNTRDRSGGRRSPANVPGRIDLPLAPRRRGARAQREGLVVAGATEAKLDLHPALRHEERAQERDAGELDRADVGRVVEERGPGKLQRRRAAKERPAVEQMVVHQPETANGAHPGTRGRRPARAPGTGRPDGRWASSPRPAGACRGQPPVRRRLAASAECDPPRGPRPATRPTPWRTRGRRDARRDSARGRRAPRWRPRSRPARDRGTGTPATRRAGTRRGARRRAARPGGTRRGPWGRTRARRPPASCRSRASAAAPLPRG